MPEGRHREDAGYRRAVKEQKGRGQSGQIAATEMRTRGADPDPSGAEQTGRGQEAAAPTVATLNQGPGPCRWPRDQLAGRRTVLMTWMTPFDCITFEIVTRATSPLASVMSTDLPFRLTVSGSPSTVLICA